MPFGEYTPLKKWILKTPFKTYVPKNEFSPHFPPNPIVANPYTLGISICLESIYPNLSRTQTQKGAQFLSVLANNAWFFQSSAMRRIMISKKEHFSSLIMYVLL